jgi:hypothetical protein
MVADVPRIECQSAVRVSLFRGFQRDLAILDHLILPFYLTHYTNSLCGERLLYNLKQ